MGGGEEGSPVWRGDGMRRDMVMGDIRMHSLHNVDSYAGESKLSPDVKWRTVIRGNISAFSTLALFGPTIVLSLVLWLL